MYKNEKSCGEFGLQSFIDELNLVFQSDFDDIKKKKDELIQRLRNCIMDRLYEQQYFVNSNKFTTDHYNIIKVYYDFYTKINDYFDELYILILSGKAAIKKLKNKGNFTNALFLEIKNPNLPNEKDEKDENLNIIEYLPFTDVNQDTSYLYHLDLGKKTMSKYNIDILKKNKVNWSKNPTIKYISSEIKRREKELGL